MKVPINYRENYLNAVISQQSSYSGLYPRINSEAGRGGGEAATPCGDTVASFKT